MHIIFKFINFLKDNLGKRNNISFAKLYEFLNKKIISNWFFLVIIIILFSFVLYSYIGVEFFNYFKKNINNDVNMSVMYIYIWPLVIFCLGFLLAFVLIFKFFKNTYVINEKLI